MPIHANPWHRVNTTTTCPSRVGTTLPIVAKRLELEWSKTFTRVNRRTFVERLCLVVLVAKRGEFSEN